MQQLLYVDDTGQMSTETRKFMNKRQTKVIKCTARVQRMDRRSVA